MSTRTKTRSLGSAAPSRGNRRKVAKLRALRPPTPAPAMAAVAAAEVGAVVRVLGFGFEGENEDCERTGRFFFATRFCPFFLGGSKI